MIMLYCQYWERNQDGTVGIAVGYGLNGLGIESNPIKAIISASHIWQLQSNINFLHYDSRCSQITGITHETIILWISGCHMHFWVSVLMQFLISQSLQLLILQTATHLPSSIVSPTDTVAQPTCASGGHRLEHSPIEMLPFIPVSIISASLLQVSGVSRCPAMNMPTLSSSSGA